MPKVNSSAKEHTSTIPDQEVDIPSSHEESASSDHESEMKSHFIQANHKLPLKYCKTCSCPTLRDPRMDWTVNDSLYHCFLKCRLKCKIMLECKPVALPKLQQCKKVIASSGDFGMDQYVSWGLTKEELKLDTIWTQFEEFCMPQF